MSSHEEPLHGRIGSLGELLDSDGTPIVGPNGELITAGGKPLTDSKVWFKIYDLVVPWSKFFTIPKF